MSPPSPNPPIYTSRPSGQQLADGRTAAKYTAATICTGEDFLDNCLKTDAEKAGSRASYEVGEGGAARGNRERDVVCAPASAAGETRRRSRHDRALGSHPHRWFEAGQDHPLPRQDLWSGKGWEAGATDERWPSRGPRAGPFEGSDRGGFMWKRRGRASTASEQSHQQLGVRGGGGGWQLWDTERRELVDNTSRVAAGAAGATCFDPFGKLAPFFSPIATAGQDLEHSRKKCNDFDADGSAERKEEWRKGATSVIPHGKREEGTEKGEAQARERERGDHVGVGNFVRGNRLDGGGIGRGSLREKVDRLESEVNPVKAGMAGAQPRLMVGTWVADGGVGVGRASGLPPADSLEALPGTQECMKGGPW